MPQSSAYLQAKFMNFDEEKGPIDDGIKKAQDLIKANGGTIQYGMIDLPGDIPPDHEDLWDAVDFLLYEWDYGMISPYYGATKEK